MAEVGLVTMVAELGQVHNRGDVMVLVRHAVSRAMMMICPSVAHLQVQWNSRNGWMHLKASEPESLPWSAFNAPALNMLQRPGTLHRKSVIS